MKYIGTYELPDIQAIQRYETYEAITRGFR